MSHLFVAMPDHPSVRMREIADAAGVSVSAVSLALRNSPKISAERRRAIMMVAEKLGYRRDPRLAELMEHLRLVRHREAPSHVAMVIPELTREQVLHYPPILNLMEGVREIAEFAGYGIDVFHLTDPSMTLQRLRSILRARGIKGVVIAPCASGVARLDFDIEGFCVATAGYSIIEPCIHRACPDYLQMMDGLLATCTTLGYQRIGLVMTYGEGGIGHKLFTSSFLYYQSMLPAKRRLPILPKPEIQASNLREWIDCHRPDVVISAGSVYKLMSEIGVKIPAEVGFASIDASEEPRYADGANHHYQLVGREALKLVLAAINLNLTGEPPHPKVVLVDSHQQEGTTLKREGIKRVVPAKARLKSRAAEVPAFRGFLD